VDGNGTVWVSNYHGGSFTELAGAGSANRGTALSPSTGFGADANLVEPYAIAVDASGNVWITNFATIPAAGRQGTITEFIGLAAPVNTPLIGPALLP
jgi:streptogramin lyase